MRVLNWKVVLGSALVALGAGLVHVASGGAAGGGDEQGGPATGRAGDVQDVIRRKCQTCHHRDGVAPFALQTYEEVARRRDIIEAVVSAGEMPPWHADPAVGSWANDRSLSEEERAQMLSWLEQGAPEGRWEAAPETRDWLNGWTLGQPDTVLTLTRPVEVPAAGPIPYEYVYVTTEFGEDRWVRGLEIRSSVPMVLHHALALVEEPIDGLDLDSVRTGGRVHPGFGLGLDGYFALYLPGQRGQMYPPGQAKLLPEGATLKLQLHYTPDGSHRTDRLQLGFTFASRQPERAIGTGAVATTDFVIPPHVEGFRVTAVHRFERPVAITGLLPHMHLRGAAFQYDLHYPSGRRTALLSVPRYDFHWQTEYIAESPIEVPAGSWLRATAWYDNSDRNPANPDPNVPVFFGEQTYDEMMIGYYTYYPLDTLSIKADD